MVTAFLRANEPRRRQFRSPRRDKLRASIGLHTAESVMDSVGPDTGAESVARFMVNRTDPGSYHDLADSDSYVHLVDYGDEAYHDGTGSNRWSTSISFACRTTDWKRMSPTQRKSFLRQGALAFKAQAEYRAKKGLPAVQLRRITKAQSDRGESGFFYHGDRDPGRRTDPGVTSSNPFPFEEFMAEIRNVMAGKAPIQELVRYHPGSRVLALTSPTMKGTDVQAVQAWAGVPVDGSYGPNTRDGVRRVQTILQAKDNRVKVTGIVDKATWPHYWLWREWKAKLDAKPVSPPVQAKPALPKLGKFTGPVLTRENLRGSYHAGVVKAQKNLKMLGAYDADIDGKFGPKFEAGLVRLQRARKIKDNGKLGTDTWAELEKWS